MFPHIPSSWVPILETEIQQPYFLSLIKFVENAYENQRCYPPLENVFAALEYCTWENTKVVILGQDPYHQLGQAHGLSFSVNDGVKFPPSLRNIFIELQNDLDIPIAISGNLTRWAKQGVLLLNDTLTVEEGKPTSHQKKGWEEFTSNIIRKISDEKEHVVFLLWGKHAQQKIPLINSERHHIISCAHPSPMSANRGGWFGNKSFSRCNDQLIKWNKTPINWNN